MSRRYSSCLSLMSPNIRSSSTSENPITAFSGVRSSWDMLARNSDLCRLAISSSRPLPSISRNRRAFWMASDPLALAQDRRGLAVDQLESLRHAQVERLRGRVVLVDGAAVRARQLVGPHGDGLEHAVDVERRADGLADLAERLELLHRFGQLARALLQLAEQPNVLHGDDGLIGEGLEDLDRRVGEEAGLGPGHVDRPDALPLLQHGDGDSAAIADGARDLPGGLV